MNVLLINPNTEQMPWPAVPVGLCTVATALERAGHDVELLDLTFSKHLARDIAAALRRRKPDLIGVTIRNIDNCNFEHPVFYLPGIRDAVIRTAREVAPDAKIVIGGSAVNVSPGDCFDFLEADYAVVGEGEEAMVELAAALDSAEPAALKRVPGLLMQGADNRAALPILDTGRIGQHEPKTGRAVVHSLESSVRSNAWKWVDLKRYAARGGPYSIQSKRGCALKCSYCVYNNIEGHAYRLRDPKDVADEMAEAIAHGAKRIDFVDSTFNLPLSHSRALCEELASRKFDVELSTMGLNPAGVTPELIQSMVRAGFKNVMCTPESASETTLKSLQKGFKKHAVIRTAKALREAGLPTYWFFMLGAPGETMETVRETLQFCEEYIPPTDMVLFSTGIRVYSGTPLERTCKDLGWFDEDDSLFMPSWYCSPELDISELYATLVKAAKVHPNWMTNAETIVTPAMATAMKYGFRALGWKGAFWTHLPKLFRLASRVGVRQRGLDEYAEIMSNIKDVAHHH